MYIHIIQSTNIISFKNHYAELILAYIVRTFF